MGTKTDKPDFAIVLLKLTELASIALIGIAYAFEASKGKQPKVNTGSLLFVVDTIESRLEDIKNELKKK